ncbi:MAG TPA: chemotaxis response regulator protein-glutamate methylesterase [Candidatus Acidoferrum sp.]|nr:chemotaxis response regulator protein-glutamate methylesterase [Candidatus Acidoferrum sp.]
MTDGKKIRVLVVDDSMMFREFISRGISQDAQIEVVAKAVDAFDARDKLIEFGPDVMTCDINMPKMDGIEFIRRLLPQYPIPVIIVSTVSEAVLDAMEAGAVEFIGKPTGGPGGGTSDFFAELITKIKAAASARVTGSAAPALRRVAGGTEGADRRKVIAIGASTGGTEAIFHVLSALPPTLPGIVIVQHIPPMFSKLFSERLDRLTELSVKEAKSGDRVERGRVLIAPGDRHMRLVKRGGGYAVECFEGEKVNGHCPSVDVLFRSVAKELGGNAIGVILTGMGADGARGLLEMRQKGCRTIGQDERSSVVYGMPKVSYDIGAVEYQMELSKIPAMIVSLAQKDLSAKTGGHPPASK